MPDVASINLDVVENPPMGTRPVTYEVYLRVKVYGYILSWSIYIDYIDGEVPKYKPHPNVLVSARGLPEFNNKNVGISAPTTRDPNQLLDMYFYAFAKWLKEVVPVARERELKPLAPLPGTTPRMRTKSPTGPRSRMGQDSVMNIEH